LATRDGSQRLAQGLLQFAHADLTHVDMLATMRPQLPTRRLARRSALVTALAEREVKVGSRPESAALDIEAFCRDPQT
jgi:hypothetical protein